MTQKVSETMSRFFRCGSVCWAGRGFLQSVIQSRTGVHKKSRSWTRQWSLALASATSTGGSVFGVGLTKTNYKRKTYLGVRSSTGKSLLAYICASHGGNRGKEANPPSPTYVNSREEAWIFW